MTSTTTDYANRQVDLELLQSVTVPGTEQRVHVTNVGDSPKLVTGVEKAVQRYAVLLLTTLGDVKFDPGAGGALLTSLLRGTISNTGYLSHLFAVANTQALRLLATDDDDDPRFGVIPDDERLTGAQLEDVTVDYSTGTVGLQILLTTAAGTDFSFIVPIGTAR